MPDTPESKAKDGASNVEKAFNENGASGALEAFNSEVNDYLRTTSGSPTADAAAYWGAMSREMEAIGVLPTIDLLDVVAVEWLKQHKEPGTYSVDDIDELLATMPCTETDTFLANQLKEGDTWDSVKWASRDNYFTNVDVNITDNDVSAVSEQADAARIVPEVEASTSAEGAPDVVADDLSAPSDPLQVSSGIDSASLTAPAEIGVTENLSASTVISDSYASPSVLPAVEVADEEAVPGATTDLDQTPVEDNLETHVANVYDTAREWSPWDWSDGLIDLHENVTTAIAESPLVEFVDELPGMAQDLYNYFLPDPVMNVVDAVVPDTFSEPIDDLLFPSPEERRLQAIVPIPGIVPIINSALAGGAALYEEVEPYLPDWIPEGAVEGATEEAGSAVPAAAVQNSALGAVEGGGAVEGDGTFELPTLGEVWETVEPFVGVAVTAAGALMLPILPAAGAAAIVAGSVMQAGNLVDDLFSPETEEEAPDTSSSEGNAGVEGAAADDSADATDDSVFAGGDTTAEAEEAIVNDEFVVVESNVIAYPDGRQVTVELNNDEDVIGLVMPTQTMDPAPPGVTTARYALTETPEGDRVWMVDGKETSIDLINVDDEDNITMIMNDGTIAQTFSDGTTRVTLPPEQLAEQEAAEAAEAEKAAEAQRQAEIQQAIIDMSVVQSGDGWSQVAARMLGYDLDDRGVAQVEDGNWQPIFQATDALIAQYGGQITWPQGIVTWPEGTPTELQAGTNLLSPEKVTAFLDDLKEKNPDLYADLQAIYTPATAS